MVGSRNSVLVGACLIAVLAAASTAETGGRLLRGYRSKNYGCDDECVWCESGICKTCKSGWEASNGGCKKCNGCSNCKKCDCNECLECDFGYIPNGHGGCEALKSFHHGKFSSKVSSGCSGWGCSSGASASVSIKTSSGGGRHYRSSGASYRVSG